jgi:hypothetical protein
MLYFNFRRIEHDDDGWIRRDWWLLLPALVLVVIGVRGIVLWFGGEPVGAMLVPAALSLAVLLYGRIRFGSRVPTFVRTATRPRSTAAGALPENRTE